MITIPLVQTEDRNVNQLQQNVKQNIERVLGEDFGSFTAVLSGFTGSVSTTVYWETGSIQNAVTLSFATFSGESNQTFMIATGLPSNLLPQRRQMGFARVVDAGSRSVGLCFVNTDGTIDFNKDVTGAAFTNSGTKGADTFNMTYTRAI